MELSSINASSFKTDSESFILESLREMTELSALKLEMVKIRLTYLNEVGKRSDKLVLASPLVSLSSFPLLMEELYTRCTVLGVELDKVIKIHLHLILYSKDKS